METLLLSTSPSCPPALAASLAPLRESSSPTRSAAQLDGSPRVPRAAEGKGAFLPGGEFWSPPSLPWIIPSSQQTLSGPDPFGIPPPALGAPLPVANADIVVLVPWLFAEELHSL